jgi:acetylornithine aminotransferase
MSLFNVYPRFDIEITHAQGAFVYDKNNRKYLDLYGGHGVISIGHAHPEYVKNINDQLSKIGFYSNSIQMPIQKELAEKLTELSNYHDYNLFLCNSGAEANENAIKLASFHTGKTKVVAFKNSFHGRTAAALNVTDNTILSAPINQYNFPVEFIELNKEQQLIKSLSNDDVCAVIIEGIQGVGGLDQSSVKYLSFLSEICKLHKVLLIIDEIQSGYGRTGDFFAHQKANIKADVITVAKGMGNGFPIGGVLINPKVKSKYGMLGTTFGGNHLACAAGISVLDTLKSKNLLKHVSVVSKLLVLELKSIPEIKKIKGTGLMLGLEFDFPIQELRSVLLNEYSIFTGASSNKKLLRILPPLTITKQEISPLIKALELSLQKIKL